MNKTINQLDEIASAELTDEAVIFDLSDSDTKKMTMQKAFNAMHKLSSTSVADSADELALYDSANNVTKKITKQNLLSEIQPPIIASSATINGPAVEEGLYIKVIFTSAISASDTVTPLEITYNGDSVPVKVMKSGVASDILAHEISSGVYSYLQAMTSFEMVYSSAETAFILVGNPIVLSSTDYTIYADGQFVQLKISTTEQWTGRYWKDGKKIYNRVLEFSVVNGLIETLSSVDSMIDIRGTFLSSSGELFMINAPSNTASGTYFYAIIFNNTNKQLNGYIQGTYINGDANVTIEYTKS